MNPVYQHTITVPAKVVDGNGHVNNVAYVQWMQDAAIAHATASGCTALSEAMGATWVARTHHIEYLRPAYAGDAIQVHTWVADFRKVRSLRKYTFVRTSDQMVLAEAQTDWVFVSQSTGRPIAIPDSIRDVLPVHNEES